MSLLSSFYMDDLFIIPAFSICNCSRLTYQSPLYTLFVKERRVMGLCFVWISCLTSLNWGGILNGVGG